MTKVIDLTEPQEPKKELKEIEFMIHLSTTGSIGYTDLNPQFYSIVKRVSRAHGDQMYDIFEAFDDDGNMIRFLGHFNDGIVK